MTLVDEPPCASPGEPPAGPPRMSPQERAWRDGEAVAASVMGTVNLAIAQLVATIGVLLSTEGWGGVGVRSPEQWVCWKAGIAHGRAAGLVRIARRASELPECLAVFAAGGLTEDAMVRIARRVPAARDAEFARLGPTLLVSQLDRILRALPEQPDGTERTSPEPQRVCRMRDLRDGWTETLVRLPADESAVVRLGMLAGRDAEFRDRNGLGPDDDLPNPADARQVDWADALVRMASEAADALDPTLGRTGNRGERFHVVLHHDVDPHGTFGPGQIEHGPVVPDPVARFVACDATVQAMTYRLGQLIGIHPTERLANRATRRYLARRDQGCAHPLCDQKLWLHAHHIVHWEDGGLTIPSNLLALCPFHHRALHHGLFSVDGDPEAGTLRFLDPSGDEIRAPDFQPPDPAPPDGPPPNEATPAPRAPAGASTEPTPPAAEPPAGPPPRRIFDPPLAERLRADDFTWNE